MDAQEKTRRVNRQRPEAEVQAPHGRRQIVIPMSRDEYEVCWQDAKAVRRLLDRMLAEHLELFPAGMREGYCLCGMGPPSKKMSGIRLRKVRIANGGVFHLRPSFVLSYMTGDAEELATPFLALAYGLPMWLMVQIFGRDEMYWYRQLERLGRNNLVGTTVPVPERMPEQLAADEHHVDWVGEKGYVAMTVGESCILGVALTDSPDDAHLGEAYGEFAAEAREVRSDYAPQTVNADGWIATHNAFRRLYPKLVIILCFLHGFIKIRESGRKHKELHRRVWEIYRAPDAKEFRARMDAFRVWWEPQQWTASVRRSLERFSSHVDEYVLAYEHPTCCRTSNRVDRPMNRLHRLEYAGRGVHGHQASSQRRLRGWALLYNFRPFAPRSRVTRTHTSLAHRLNGKHYHDNWLQNLNVSASCRGCRNVIPKIR